MSPDDQERADWLDGLAGRPGNESSMAYQEGVRLRAAALSGNAIARQELPTSDAGLQRFLQRARTARILPVVPTQAPWTTLIRRMPRWRAGLGLAASIMIGLVIYHRTPLPPPAPVLRGGKTSAVHLLADDPGLVQQRLLSDLKMAGVSAQAYKQLGTWGLNAHVPTPIDGSLKKQLEHEGVVIPLNGELNIEIRRKPLSP